MGIGAFWDGSAMFTGWRKCGQSGGKREKLLLKLWKGWTVGQTFKVKVHNLVFFNPVNLSSVSCQLLNLHIRILPHPSIMLSLIVGVLRRTHQWFIMLFITFLTEHDGNEADLTFGHKPLNCRTFNRFLVLLVLLLQYCCEFFVLLHWLSHPPHF